MMTARGSEQDREKWMEEFKPVPLRGSEPHPYAISVKAGNTIGIGFEVPKRDMSAIRNAGRGRRGGSGLGGSMPPGGGGGMRGGGGMGRRPEMANGLKVWATAQLASGAVRPPSN